MRQRDNAATRQHDNTTTRQHDNATTQQRNNATTQRRNDATTQRRNAATTQRRNDATTQRRNDATTQRCNGQKLTATSDNQPSPFLFLSDRQLCYVQPYGYHLAACLPNNEVFFFSVSRRLSRFTSLRYLRTRLPNPRKNGVPLHLSNDSAFDIPASFSSWYIFCKHCFSISNAIKRIVSMIVASYRAAATGSP
jgi:hypothetical protein